MEDGVKDGEGACVDDHDCGHVTVAVAVVVGMAEDSDPGV